MIELTTTLGTADRMLLVEIMIATLFSLAVSILNMFKIKQLKEKQK